MLEVGGFGNPDSSPDYRGRINIVATTIAASTVRNMFHSIDHLFQVFYLLSNNIDLTINLVFGLDFSI